MHVLGTLVGRARPRPHGKGEAFCRAGVGGAAGGSGRGLNPTRAGLLGRPLGVPAKGGLRRAAMAQRQCVPARSAGGREQPRESVDVKVGDFQLCSLQQIQLEGHGTAGHVLLWH